MSSPWPPELPLSRGGWHRPPRPLARGPAPALEAPWALPREELLARLEARPEGLRTDQAAERLERHGRNELREERRLSRLSVLWNQVRSPLLLLLVFAAGASLATREWGDAAIVLAIVVVTVGVGFTREYTAQRALAELRARVRTRARVLRDGTAQLVPVEEVVPGDVVLLAAGTLVPADAVLLAATDCHASEGVLTGESFPVEKTAQSCPANTPLARRTNCVHMGTNIRSGTARALVVRTGAATEFGRIAHRLALRSPETEFERGLRRFGTFLATAMLFMVLLVFVAHVLNGRPPVETLLFAIALAVGLSPELLPMILTVNLARAARLMAKGGVLVRRLNAIENLGSMDVLCTDKTGTLTEGVVKVEGAYAPQGTPSEAVLELAALNAALETGLGSPLDDAVLQARTPDLAGLEKRAEVPFDFVRKRVSVVVADARGARLITKGAVPQVLAACTRLEDGTPLDGALREALAARHDAWGAQGIRVLAVAVRDLPEAASYSRADEEALSLAGFVTFLDRPKPGVAQALADLAALGVTVKIITGDSRLVAQHVAALVGLRSSQTLTGRDLDALHDETLWHVVERTDLFAEVDPRQKERVIRALQRTGHVVGFLGDGVNDAPSMHIADTALSVEHAVDVARDAADFVLLESDLEVIRRGIEEGRRTFANTLKYLLTTISANLGNMLSMAVASLFLPFLPLTAGQILLNNFLSDVPAFGVAEDRVDPELVAQPRRWDIRFIGRFMTTFGALSSVFDLLTFALLLAVFRATPAEFRTAWFVESLLTELVVALIVRTRRPFFRSRPGSLLLRLTLLLIPCALALPYLPQAFGLGFTPLPAPLLAALLAVTALYAASAEVLKRWFYRRSGDVDL